MKFIVSRDGAYILPINDFISFSIHHITEKDEDNYVIMHTNNNGKSTPIYTCNSEFETNMVIDTILDFISTTNATVLDLSDLEIKVNSDELIGGDNNGQVY